MSGIVWLASYPKSGNTWFRVFLANLRGDGQGPADINDLRSSPIASARGLFDDAVGIESSDLTHDEAARLRPEVYAQLAREATETLFIKIHDAFTFLDDGRPLFAGSSVKGAVYIIRNPLDVAVSLAHHLACSVDEAIEAMNNPEYAFCRGRKRLHYQLRQKLLSWSEHVLSWVDTALVPVHIMRYEDMKLRPLETFAAAARFAGLADDRELIARALGWSSFDELRRQEKERGFKERSAKSESFFRRGEIGSWRETLSDEQARRVITTHASVMRRFDYLNASEEPQP